MADIKVYGTLVNATSDKAIAKAEQIVGGFMSLTTEERNSLPSTVKKDGMLVYDTTESKMYQLENGAWEEYSVGTLDYNNLTNKPAIDGNTLTKDSKLSDILSTTQLSAINSGIDNTLVEQIDANTDDIEYIQDGTLIVGKATSDGNGNNIANTYATKTEVNAKQNKLTQGVGVSINDSANTISLDMTDAENGKVLMASSSTNVGWVTIETHITAEDYDI